MTTEEEKGIHVHPKEGTEEIIIRHGEAPAPQRKQPLHVKGTLTAPANYYRANTRWIVPGYCHVLASYSKGYINLIVNNHDPDDEKDILGELRLSKELRVFNINQDYAFSKNELQKLIRRSKYYFQDKEHHGELITQLQAFTFNIQTQVKDYDDKKGNVERLLKKELENLNIDLAFKLYLNPFDDPELSNPTTFDVEILVDIDSSGAISFYLESNDLRSFLEVRRTELVEEQLQRIDTTHIPKIIQS